MGTSTTALLQTLRRKGVRCGDVVRLHKKPHYVQSVTRQYIVMVSMDERKMFVTLWG